MDGAVRPAPDTATREGPLAWGQYLPWVTEKAAPEMNPYFKMVTFDLMTPEGVTMEMALSVLDEVICRHEGLRTTFARVDGVLRQFAHPMRDRGYRHLVIDDDHADGQPPQRITTWIGEPFDLANEWPIRVGGWRATDGRIVLRVAVHRMVLDREGMLLMRMHFFRGVQARLAASASQAPGDSAGADVSAEDSAPIGAAIWSPIDIANYEHSAAGQRIDARAYSYWHQVLRTAPESMFRTSRPGAANDSRFTVHLSRAGLRRTVGELATSLGVTEPIVVMSASLLAMSWVGGWPRVCATVAAANRARREMRGALSPMLDRSIINIEVIGEQTFGQWVRAVASSTLGAYHHSHADPNTLLRAYAQSSIDRGVQLERLPIVNVLGTGVTRRTPGGTEDMPDLNFPVPPDGTTTKAMARPLDGIYVRSQILWRRVTIEVIVGEQVCDEATARRLAELIASMMETVVLHGDQQLSQLASLVPDSHLGVREEGTSSPADRRAGWVCVDHTLVDPAEVRALLGECEGVRDSLVFVSNDAGVDRLHAYVVGDERVTDLRRLRLAVIGRLPFHRRVLCPHWFRVVARSPETTDGWADQGNAQARWATLPVIVEGSGGPTPHDQPLPPQGPVEQAVVDALVAAHPGMDASQVDLATPYCLAGGRFENIPVFLAELKTRGINGVSVDALMSTQPLVNLVRSDSPADAAG